MKQFPRWVCLSVLGLNLMASQLASAINGRYTFSDLDIFWKNVLKGEEGPSLGLYRSILKSMDDTPQEKVSRQEGAWQKDQNTLVKVPYFVESLPADSAAAVARRELSLHMYLNREASYQAPAPANPAELLASKALIRKQQTTLSSRRLQAAYELFVIKLIRYREAGTLNQKCQALDESERYLKLGNSQISSDGNASAELKAYADTLSNRYANEISQKLVCLAKPAQDRAESLARIETDVNAKIVASLNREATQTLVPIQNLVQGTFDPILNRVYRIDPMTGLLLQFEQDIQSAAASVELVNKDIFRIQGVLPELDKIDFKIIRDTAKTSFVPEAIEKVSSKQKLLNDFTRQFLLNLEALQKIVPAQDRPLFASCVGLSQEFDKILPKAPTVFGAQTIYPGLGPTDTLLSRLDTCLTKTRDQLLKMNSKDSQEKMVEIFAKHLEALTKVIIQVSN